MSHVPQSTTRETRARRQTDADGQSAASNSGSSLNRSPTRPMSAISKIGASASLLIATIVPASLMPVRCWIAPEMPIGDVELRRDDLAGLADLHVAGHVAGIDRGARSADRGAELVGELVDDLEVLRRTDAAAAGDDAAGALQVGTVGLARRPVRRSACGSAVRASTLDGLDRRAATARGFRP